MPIQGASQEAGTWTLVILMCLYVPIEGPPESPYTEVGLKENKMTRAHIPQEVVKPKSSGSEFGVVDIALILVLVTVVIIVALALIGPSMGNVFSNTSLLL